MAAIPDKYLDLLQQKKAFANLATLMPDGSPQVTPVWIDYTDGADPLQHRQGAGQGAQSESRVAGGARHHGSRRALPLSAGPRPRPPCRRRGCRRAYRSRWPRSTSARTSIRSANPAKSASCTKSSRNPPPEWAEAASIRSVIPGRGRSLQSPEPMNTGLRTLSHGPVFLGSGPGSPAPSGMTSISNFFTRSAAAAPARPGRTASGSGRRRARGICR